MRKNSGLLFLVLMAMMSMAFGILVASKVPAARAAVTEYGSPLYLDGASWEPRPSEEIAQAGQFPNFVPIVGRTLPAVVSVTSTEERKLRERSPENGFPSSPFEFFFGPNPRANPHPQQPGEEPPVRRSTSYGSGFIISADGYVLTNYHVVADAAEVTIGLYESKETFPAQVIGRDQEVDIALLKIDPKGRELPVIPLGNSDSLQVGEWVLAIGNPFGLPHTVTSGIVSAVGREIGGSALDSYVQTDAAINQGNSGGPLINLRGEVVGINTLISAYAQNIGFAVPVNMAKRALPDLKESGRVARGYLGVQIGSLNGDYREAFHLPPTQDGALVNSVEPGLPGDKAGLRHGDVVTEVDGVKVADSAHLVREIAQKKPGQKVEIKIIRNGKPMTLHAMLGDRGTALFKEEQEQEDDKPAPEPKIDPIKALKIQVMELTPALRREAGLDDSLQGVMVREVSPSSDAYAKGLRHGMVITEANRRAVSSVEQLQKALEGVKPGQLVLLYVVGADFRGYVPVRIPQPETK